MYTSSNGQKSFSYRGASLWNNLAIGVKQAPSLSVFKQMLLFCSNAANQDFNLFLSIQQLPILILGFYDVCILI